MGHKITLGESANFRTIGSIVMNYSNWQASGGKKNDAKNYANCIQQPVVTGDSNKLILDVIPPPELHLMLGVVNTVFDHMLISFSNEANAWAKSCNFTRDMTHGSSFNGNSC